ncbi:MAG: S1 RNA-binding domain-containing protein [Thermoanaerobacteraceae bacterium]|uniref:S1 RNA-binding domain-containing protein n=1 Tax=Thermanaeromonas sp. C210 TaxID=2731925 RepID=UPI00155C4A97|nr:S1 RNA-binding domain-containing protein [Thermanaeromonas sp. C210]MBE3580201.1 S1 RNA-binding domain-containing protein [Thermoanaerobacteraceae bacterium]GFN22964.1 RNA-binding protein S1 [Thermanaeromonas sp. C210]
MTIEVGSILEGVVTGVTKFGAFVELPGGVTGLVHISEVAHTFVKDVSDYVKVQDRVRVKVIRLDEGGKIGLSIKRALPEPERTGKRASSKPRAHASFEEKLARFLRESDERLQDLRRQTEARRRGRGARSY